VIYSRSVTLGSQDWTMGSSDMICDAGGWPDAGPLVSSPGYIRPGYDAIGRRVRLAT